jgi:hypothetical protein
MKASASFSASQTHDSVEVLWEDAERAFCRLRYRDTDPRHAFIPVGSDSGHPTLETINRFGR